MTKKERIEWLEYKVLDLEKKLKDLESKMRYKHPSPLGPWISETTTCNPCNIHGISYTTHTADVPSTPTH